MRTNSPVLSLAGILAVAVAVSVVVLAPAKAKAEMSPSQCQEEKDQLVNRCWPVVVLNQNPSANCCKSVRVAHVECVCPYVTPELTKLVNVERIIKQIRGCGRTIPHNFKCGSEFLSHSLISYGLYA